MEKIISAPGKIMWIGGYAVLEQPNISYNTGVDKRVFARAVETEGITFNMPQFNLKLTASFDGEKIIFGKELSEEEKPVEFVKGVAETCLQYLKAKGKETKSFELTTLTDPAFGLGETKTGLGSSAAVTAASTAAIMALHGYDIQADVHLIHKLAQYIHATVQGKVGSGFDIATACFGGHAYSRYSPELIKEKGVVEAVDADWDYTATPIAVPKGFKTALGDIVGESTSTREMVKKYRAYKEAEPAAFASFIREVNDANQKAIDAMKKLNEFSESNAREYDTALEPLEHPLFKEFVAAFNEARAKTKELGERIGAGIEPEESTRLLDASNGNGAIVSRLPGAGGGDAIAAWCKSSEDKAKLESFWSGYQEVKVKPIELSVSSKGLKTEEASSFSELAKKCGVTL